MRGGPTRKRQPAEQGRHNALANTVLVGDMSSPYEPTGRGLETASLGHSHSRNALALLKHGNVCTRRSICQEAPDRELGRSALIRGHRLIDSLLRLPAPGGFLRQREERITLSPSRMPGLTDERRWMRERLRFFNSLSKGGASGWVAGVG